MIVVKVGGSLYDHPGLGPGLAAFLNDRFPGEIVWLVPGGGPFADAVRALDRVHALDEENAHWIALRSLSAAALFLASLLPDTRVANQITGIPRTRFSVLDPHDFVLSDDGHAFNIPASWDVTSDSLAAYAAAATSAPRLMLLKSVDIPPGIPWAEAAVRGWVDRHFPTVVAAHGIDVEAVNFRRWLDSRPT